MKPAAIFIRINQRKMRYDALFYSFYGVEFDFLEMKLWFVVKWLRDLWLFICVKPSAYGLVQLLVKGQEISSQK